MRTKRSTKSVLAALLLAFLVISTLPGTSDAHNYLRFGWPQEPEDPDFVYSSGGGSRQEDRGTPESQSQPEGVEAEKQLSILILWLRESLKLIWIR